MRSEAQRAAEKTDYGGLQAQTFVASNPSLGLPFTQVEFKLLFIEFRGAAELSFCAKRGRKIQGLRRENPSLREGKSKP